MTEKGFCESHTHPINDEQNKYVDKNEHSNKTKPPSFGGSRYWGNVMGGTLVRARISQM